MHRTNPTNFDTIILTVAFCPVPVVDVAFFQKYIIFNSPLQLRKRSDANNCRRQLLFRRRLEGLSFEIIFYLVKYGHLEFLFIVITYKKTKFSKKSVKHYLRCQPITLK